MKAGGLDSILPSLASDISGTVIDVGANEGDVTRLLAQYNPKRIKTTHYKIEIQPLGRIDEVIRKILGNY